MHSEQWVRWDLLLPLNAQMLDEIPWRTENGGRLVSTVIR
jgi:hypothetical protein